MNSMTIAYGLLYYIQKIVSPQFESAMIEKIKMVQEVDSIRCLGCLTPHLLCLIHNSSLGFVDSPAWALQHLVSTVSCFKDSPELQTQMRVTLNSNPKTKSSQCPWEQSLTNAMVEADALNYYFKLLFQVEMSSFEYPNWNWASVHSNEYYFTLTVFSPSLSSPSFELLLTEINS